MKSESVLKEEAKNIRSKIRDKFKAEKNRLFIYNSNQAKEDIRVMHEILDEIKNLVLAFMNKYVEAKKEKNIIDFTDIEQLALKILVKKNEEGNLVASEVANSYQEKFEEIAIDEYQDSNLVQEYILNAISRGNNIFMVGDVKQSIYKFRQARPELFLEKYDEYKDILVKGTCIQLFKNFRSRKEVLDMTNLVFANIMSKQLGDIEYTEDEYLNLGSNYSNELHEKEINAYKPELHIIDVGQAEGAREHEGEEYDVIENSEVEARFVAKRIKDMLDNSFQVFDKNLGYRNAELKDIAILLRTTSQLANVYEKELKALGITSFSDVGNSYFEEIEVKTIIAMLTIIDNPNNDIPLVTVLRSMIGGFTDNELLEVRLENKGVGFYEALKTVGAKQGKANEILRLLQDLQSEQEHMKLHEFIWHLYEKTGYYDYVRTIAKWRNAKRESEKTF